MFNTLSTPFSLMDSVDIIHLKIGRAPLPTVYGWNGTHCLDAQAKGGPMIRCPSIGYRLPTLFGKGGPSAKHR